MIKFSYQFRFPKTGEETVVYSCGLDEETLDFIYESEDTPERAETPSWANLKNNKCEGCELDESENELCPIAENLSNLVHFFKDVKSYKEAMIFVDTKERAYAKDASAQEGLFSIFGLIMSTSGCPKMNFLKPLARFHLPFATSEETFLRAASIYLLREYLKEAGDCAGREVSLKGLIDNYKEVSKVNKGILERIRNVAKGDADQNALIILDNFAQIIASELETSPDTLRNLLMLT